MTFVILRVISTSCRLSEEGRRYDCSAHKSVRSKYVRNRLDVPVSCSSLFWCCLCQGCYLEDIQIAVVVVLFRFGAWAANNIGFVCSINRCRLHTKQSCLCRPTVATDVPSLCLLRDLNHTCKANLFVFLSLVVTYGYQSFVSVDITSFDNHYFQCRLFLYAPKEVVYTMSVLLGWLKCSPWLFPIVYFGCVIWV